VKRLAACVGFPVLLALAAALGLAQFPPPPGTGPGLPETIEAIDSARITTRILYVTAHPDDESGAVLTYLARGLHADVALLSVTRGEGGQNDLGPEQAPQLGLIRTQELLAATRAYGVKLYFTRAQDFGFSKTPEETQRIWGDAVLEDMVRVIREVRPNVVINNFGGVHGGHGHHQTAGLWTPKAVALAADPKAYPSMYSETFGYDSLIPWDGDGLPVQTLDIERGSEKPHGFVLPLDEISPLYGKTYRDIGTDAFANHRTQGVSVFLGSPFFRRPIALIPENDGKFDIASLAVPLKTWADRVINQRCISKGISNCRSIPAPEVDAKILAARAAALKLDWKTATEELAAAGKLLERDVPAHRYDVESDGSVTQDHLRDYWAVQERLNHALALAAGIRITADADRSELVVGESFNLTTATQCRPEAQCEFGELGIVHNHGAVNSPLPVGGGEHHFQIAATPPTPVPTTDSPVEPPRTESTRTQHFPIVFVSDKLLPEPPTLYVAEQKIAIGGYPFTVREPVTHVEASSTRVERVPLRIVPAYTLSVEPDQAVEVLAKPRKSFDVLLRVHSHATQAGKVNVGLDVPQGWTASAPAALEFSSAGDQYARVTLIPPQKLAASTFKIAAYAQRGAEKFTESLEPLPTLRTQFWSEPAQCVVHAFDINVPENLRVGYITAESEPVPEALQRLGVHVEMLDAAALAFSDLSHFDAIVVGVRAYELRSDLPGANQRLLDYASNGGTLVVQYERDFAWARAQYAPYPAKIAPPPNGPLPRVTDENSPVKFLKPDNPLLNRPNKITQDDFKGWVQERGLYFWTQFDAKYTPLLAMNDPGEIDQNGALVYTPYGKGTYIYTGIAFFRQLPEGVPGAYRLFVNLLSASRATR
jgi:LmbE family N-acetylglucosaminyl deacetylase